MHKTSSEPPAVDSLVWQNVQVGGSGPRPRALHIGAVIDDAFFLHGGYDGNNRCGDFWRFDLTDSRWWLLSTPADAAAPPAAAGVPSARDRHACVVVDGKLHMFGGYDGSNRVNDFWEFDPRTGRWTEIGNSHPNSTAPSPRHSHSMFTYERKIFVLFGYDGVYRNDMYAFDVDLRVWTPMPTRGALPKPRYRNSATVVNERLFVFGGHDGIRHLGDAFLLDLKTFEWQEVTTAANPSISNFPAPRDSHSACVHSNGLVMIFGGSSGSARADLIAFDPEKRTWQEWKFLENSQSPVPRFCHVAVMYEGSLYVNSGYDGQTRLNDFKRLPLPDNMAVLIPDATVITDLRNYVNNPQFSDVSFSLPNGVQVKAHKLLLARNSYFACLLNSAMSESVGGEIHLKDVSERVLIKLLEVIYTDQVYIEDEDMEFVLELLVISDRFGVERLKAICEVHVMQNINFDNSSLILQVADQHSALMLRSKAMDFILKNFDAVSKLKHFEELAKKNVDLILEIIRKR